LSQSESPDFRVAFDPDFSNLCSSGGGWRAALAKLVELRDDKPLVVTEGTENLMQLDRQEARGAGLRTLLAPRCSNFLSPFVVYDDMGIGRGSDSESVIISNSHVAVFGAGACLEEDSASDAMYQSEGSTDDLAIEVDKDSGQGAAASLNVDSCIDHAALPLDLGERIAEVGQGTPTSSHLDSRIEGTSSSSALGKGSTDVGQVVTANLKFDSCIDALAAPSLFAEGISEAEARAPDVAVCFASDSSKTSHTRFEQE